MGKAATELHADAIVVGAGLAGLVAAGELLARGRRVLLLEQEPRASLGGQAHWSLGGLFLVDSPEQRRARIRDSFELAWADWLGSARFDRPEDEWPRRFAQAYVEFAAGEKRAWLKALGIRVLPSPGWAERGAGSAGGHGNSVPRFHLTWGTGPAVLAPFLARLQTGIEAGRATLCCRHRVDALLLEGGGLAGVSGTVLEPSAVARGRASSRNAVGEFVARAPSVLIASGGIGHNLELIRSLWPLARLGPPPAEMVAGVPAHVDGRLLEIVERSGAAWIGKDRMWHYTEGIRNWAPVWENHGIRILPAPSSLWFDAAGQRLPAPLYPGFDTLAALAHLGRGGHGHSWFVLNRRIVAREFALSGSEQNPDITGRNIGATVRTRLLPEVPAPIQRFLDHGPDFVVAERLEELVAGMNRMTGDAPHLELELLRAQIVARDRQVANPFGKDLQIAAIRAARRYLPDRLTRVARPHPILDPAAGPLIAVRLHVLTRKTLGGLATDLDGQVLRPDGQPLPGLFAAGEAAGFGGGGMHGYNALEGTFLGGCLFSGRVAGRAMAARL